MGYLGNPCVDVSTGPSGFVASQYCSEFRTGLQLGNRENLDSCPS